MRNHLPTYASTHKLIRRLSRYYTFGQIAKACGKERATAEAWSREPASIENPTGSGKSNPFDCELRVIGMAHEKDPALAREMAEMHIDYVNHLDGIHAHVPPIHELIGSTVKEHSEVIVMLLNDDEPDFAKVNTEITEAIIALEKLQIFVKDEMKGALKAVPKTGNR